MREVRWFIGYLGWLLVVALFLTGCATGAAPLPPYSADDATRAMEQARDRQWQDEERARIWREVRPYTVRP